MELKAGLGKLGLIPSDEELKMLKELYDTIASALMVGANAQSNPFSVDRPGGGAPNNLATAAGAAAQAAAAAVRKGGSAVAAAAQAAAAAATATPGQQVSYGY